MERKTGAAIAGGVSLILVAGAIALGANLGLMRGAEADPAGKLRPTDPAATVARVKPERRVVTVEVKDPGAASQQRPVQFVDIPVPAAAGTSSSSFEDESEDRESEDRDHAQEDREDPEHHEDEGVEYDD